MRFDIFNVYLYNIAVVYLEYYHLDFVQQYFSI